MGLCLGQRMKSVDTESYTPTRRNLGQSKHKICVKLREYICLADEVVMIKQCSIPKHEKKCGMSAISIAPPAVAIIGYTNARGDFVRIT